MVGGELSLDQLELSYSPTLGFYRAPVQAVANGGVLVIDDFGRQTCSPRELLNRWIVPLESRVDFLTLQTGQKFDFPFMTMIVFATNIRPGELVDEAFLRRIHYKIFAESPTKAEFLQIFENCCRSTGSSSARRGRMASDHVFQAASDSAARLPAARSDRAGHVARRLSRGSRRSSRRSSSRRPVRAYFVDDQEAPPHVRVSRCRSQPCLCRRLALVVLLTLVRGRGGARSGRTRRSA